SLHGKAAALSRQLVEFLGGCPPLIEGEPPGNEGPCLLIVAGIFKKQESLCRRQDHPLLLRRWPPIRVRRDDSGWDFGGVGAPDLLFQAKREWLGIWIDRFARFKLIPAEGHPSGAANSPRLRHQLLLRGRNVLARQAPQLKDVC